MVAHPCAMVPLWWYPCGTPITLDNGTHNGSTPMPPRCNGAYHCRYHKTGIQTTVLGTIMVPRWGTHPSLAKVYYVVNSGFVAGPGRTGHGWLFLYVPGRPGTYTIRLLERARKLCPRLFAGSALSISSRTPMVRLISVGTLKCAESSALRGLWLFATMASSERLMGP
jgi:hypothetical protein